MSRPITLSRVRGVAAMASVAYDWLLLACDAGGDGVESFDGDQRTRHLAVPRDEYG